MATGAGPRTVIEELGLTGLISGMENRRGEKILALSYAERTCPEGVPEVSAMLGLEGLLSVLPAWRAAKDDQYRP